MIRNLHLRDRLNPGDWHSAPLLYFDPGCPFEVADLAQAGATTKGPVILGGGGLLGNEAFKPSVERILGGAKESVVTWGLGHNGHRYPFRYRVSYRGLKRLRSYLRWLLVILKFKPLYYDLGLDYAPLAPLLSQVKVNGVRDYGCGHEWVPCASCMHPAFDRLRDRRPTHPVVVYEHPDFMQLDVPWPKRANRDLTLVEALEFLASGEVIVTSSYHGAYWGVLLGRRVVCVPWSTKFMAFRHRPTLAIEMLGLEVQCWRARRYPEALKQCREANLQHAARVSQHLGVELRARQQPLDPGQFA